MASWNEKKKKRYAEDPEYREAVNEANRRYQAAHRQEINAHKRRRYASDPDYRARCAAANAKVRRANLFTRYGISWPEYQLRLALQKGVCAICRKAPKQRLLCVDHCHKTGKVRGLLCTRCNAALGSFEDDAELAQAGANYLRAFDESLEPRGDVMTSTDEQTECGEATRLMRKAILHEPQCGPGEADDGASDKLRLIARRLVDKATEGDIQAIKEVLDRIDGKTVAGPADGDQSPRQVSIRWKDSPSASSTSAAGNSPPSAGAASAPPSS